MNTNVLFMHQHLIHRHRLCQLPLVLLISFTLISCVTINIYFPAAAAEKAAEKIVDEVLKSGEPGPDQKLQKELNQAPKLKQESVDPQTFYKTDGALLAILNFFIPVAEAEQANISIETAKIRSIRTSLEKRQSKLQPFYQSGAIGFTNNGLIARVSSAALSVKQKSTVNKLIKSENRDRQALYTEIANANGHPEWLSDIQKTFSKTWINKISSGWMYQTSSGQWRRK